MTLTRQEFEKVIEAIMTELRKVTPYDTGNLANDATDYVMEDENTCVIYVDESIAPYMYYVNEYWEGKRRSPKIEQNEHYWDRFVENIKNIISSQLKGSWK